MTILSLEIGIAENPTGFPSPESVTGVGIKVELELEMSRRWVGFAGSPGGFSASGDDKGDTENVALVGGLMGGTGGGTTTSSSLTSTTSSASFSFDQQPS